MTSEPVGGRGVDGILELPLEPIRNRFREREPER